MGHQARQETTEQAKAQGQALGDRLQHNNHNDHKAEAALQADLHRTIDTMKHQPAAVRDAFYKSLAAINTANDHLPQGLQITNDQSGLHVKEKGKSVYDQKSVERQANKETKIGSGEGPEAAFRREGHSPQDATTFGQYVKQQTGKGAHDFKQGEQYKVNDDGTVSCRVDDPKVHGKYTETKYNEGKTIEKITDDGHGRMVDEKFQKDGRTLTSRTTEENGKKVTENFESDGKSLNNRVTEDGNKKTIENYLDGKLNSRQTTEPNKRVEEQFDASGEHLKRRTTYDGQPPNMKTTNETHNGPESEVKITQPDGSWRSVKTKDGQFDQAQEFHKVGDSKGDETVTIKPDQNHPDQYTLESSRHPGVPLNGTYSQETGRFVQAPIPIPWTYSGPGGLGMAEARREQ